jgi:hypothetical protein
LVYAEAGDDRGDVLAEEQLEVIWVVDVHYAKVYQFVAAGTQVNGLGESQRRDPTLAGVAIAPGVDGRECRRRSGVLGDPESAAGQYRADRPRPPGHRARTAGQSDHGKGNEPIGVDDWDGQSGS